jgi:flavin-dependent dehydrogenase
MVPPFTGNGMSMAIESAVIASDSLLGYSSGRINWPDCIQYIREKLHRRFHRRLLLAKWLHPFLVYPSGQRLAMFCASMNLLPFDRLFHQLRNS